MLDILYDLHQNRRIGDASARAEASLRQTERAGDRISDLEERLDKMSLLNLALWSLLKEKLNLSEEELAAKVQELDLQDGKIDGRIGSVVQDCPDCHRPMHARHRRCLYCGFEPSAGGFESVAR